MNGDRARDFSGVATRRNAPRDVIAGMATLTLDRAVAPRRDNHFRSRVTRVETRAFRLAVAPRRGAGFVLGAVLATSAFLCRGDGTLCRRARRAAFTIVELLVVIAIIGALLAFLLPAINAAREAARRGQCIGRLAQLTLAANNYEALHGVYPPGYVTEVDDTGEDLGPGWGWATMLLPQMEENSLFAKIDLRLPIEAAENAAARVAQLEFMLCASDNARSTVMASRHDPSGRETGQICEIGAANYVGVFGITEPGVDGEGILFRNSKIATKQIKDGTSHTMLIGERSHRWAEATWVGAVTGASMFPTPTSPAVPFVQNAASMILGHTFEGPPNTPGLEGNNFTSAHPSGAGFGFADGHVKFISDSIDRETYHALSTRAAGDKIKEDY
ncbi:MAG: DUF1559 domain-containing protein [Planctomycetales bacterium]|nr:DUF1559 domain-containing protein [Planctomycetales bacterium]